MGCLSASGFVKSPAVVGRAGMLHPTGVATPLTATSDSNVPTVRGDSSALSSSASVRVGSAKAGARLLRSSAVPIPLRVKADASKSALLVKALAYRSHTSGIAVIPIRTTGLPETLLSQGSVIHSTVVGDGALYVYGSIVCPVDIPSYFLARGFISEDAYIDETGAIQERTY